MEDETQFYSHLQKLSPIKSEQEFEKLLILLWKTRKTGISASDKSSIHSLLHLSSISELDPVLACLRSLIRKFVRGNLSSGGMLKLFPQGFSLELQSMLIRLLENHQKQWMEELSRDKDPSARSRFSNQAPLMSLPPEIAESQSVGQESKFLQSSLSPPGNTGSLPRLKSMNWTSDNESAAQADTAAIISLKLEDDIKSPSEETEVKFRLSRDTLDAMLKSLAYIKEQLPTSGGSSTEPLQKKQRQ